MLSPRPTLSLLTKIMSWIQSALELQNIHSLAGPFNCDRVMTPSPKDNLIVGVCFIPITYSVIIFFLAGASGKNSDFFHTQRVCCLLVLNLVSSTLTKIGDILPWEDVEGEAEKLLEGTRANVRDQENSGDSQEQDDDRV